MNAFHRTLPAMLTVGLCLFATAPAAKANLLVNGDFASGDLTGWTVTGTSAQVGVSYNPVVSGNAVYAADNNEMGYLSQTFTTKVGDTYALSFLTWTDLLGNGYTSDNINNAAPFFSGFVIDKPSRDWVNTQFVATTTSTTLNIGFKTNPGEGTMWIADAEVHDVTTPEPATLSAAGILTLLGLRRTRRATRSA